MNVDRLREAARRSGMPRNVTVADIENLAREYAALPPVAPDGADLDNLEAFHYGLLIGQDRLQAASKARFAEYRQRADRSDFASYDRRLRAGEGGEG